MSNAKKRRSASAADIEIEHIEGGIRTSSSNEQKPRRRTNARQARLIRPPVFGLPIHQSAGTPFISNSISSLPAMQLVPPVYNQVANNSGCGEGIYWLVSNYPMEQLFQFNVQKERYRTFLLICAVPNFIHSFRINNLCYTAAKFPIDVTESVVNGANTIAFGILPTDFPVCFQLKCEMLQNYESVVKEVKESRIIPPPIPRDPVANSVCPISRTEIETPVRGIECKHYQCFDLKTYISFSYARNSWQCPICQKYSPIEFLCYIPNYMKESYSFASVFDDPNNMSGDESLKLFLESDI